jgi:hypothetical protein
MFPILLLAGADVVLIVIFITLRLVLAERANQRIQRERAALYFATRDRRAANR